MSDFDTKEISDIKIEDPLNFLTAAEKEAYIRAQDAGRMRARREELSRTQELQRLEEERIAEEHRRSKEQAELAARRARARKRRAIERRREEREKELRNERIVRIASIVTGTLILIALLVIGASYVKSYFDDRAEEDQIAADADGSVLPEEEEDGGGASALPEGFTAMNDTVKTTTDLRLRSTPDSSVDNNIVTTATKGSELKRTGINDAIGWSQVNYNGQTLYCASKYLE